MLKQHTTSRAPKSTEPALFGLALMLFGDLLEQAAVQLSHLHCMVAGGVLKLLPAIFLALCQALETYAFEHEGLFVCFQKLVSCWQLLHLIVGKV